MSNEEYQELREAAADALRELLRNTEPGTGLYLHTTLAKLRREIDQETRQDENTVEPVGDRPRWTVLSTLDRERQVLDALSEQRLTINELRSYLDEHTGYRVYHSHVAAVVRGLFVEARELDRVGERYTRGKSLRYRYFRRTKLEGPIADLQRQIDGEADA